MVAGVSSQLIDDSFLFLSFASRRNFKFSFIVFLFFFFIEMVQFHLVFSKGRQCCGVPGRRIVTKLV